MVPEEHDSIDEEYKITMLNQLYFSKSPRSINGKTNQESSMLKGSKTKLFKSIGSK